LIALEEDSGGAWLPEPHPPEELSDDEIRRRIDEVLADSEDTDVREWAADVIEAVLDAEQRRLRVTSEARLYTPGETDRIRKALRRRP
jgi:hypothetical protein